MLFVQATQDELGNIHHDGRARKLVWNPTPAFEREAQLLYSLAERDIQLLHGVRIQEPVDVQPVPALEAFHRVNQSVVVEVSAPIDRGLGRQVPDKAQPAYEPGDGRVNIAGLHSLLGGGKRLAIVLPGEGFIELQRLLRAAIPLERRLDAVEDGFHLLRVHVQESLPQEVRQVVLLVLNVEVEVEGLGVDLANVQVRDVAHDADG